MGGLTEPIDADRVLDAIDREIAAKRHQQSVSLSLSVRERDLMTMIIALVGRYGGSVTVTDMELTMAESKVLEVVQDPRLRAYSIRTRDKLTIRRFP